MENLLYFEAKLPISFQIPNLNCEFTFCILQARFFDFFLVPDYQVGTCLLICIFLQTMETRPTVPDRKLLARLVLIREEARNMMGGGILDERNDRGLNTLPESEVVFPLFELIFDSLIPNP